MTWEEIKRTPRWELEGLLAACHEYNLLHSMDGYDAKDISGLAKNKPSIRQDWGRYVAQQRKYEMLAGQTDAVDSAVEELKSELG